MQVTRTALLPMKPFATYSTMGCNALSVIISNINILAQCTKEYKTTL